MGCTDREERVKALGAKGNRREGGISGPPKPQILHGRVLLGLVLLFRRIRLVAFSFFVSPFWSSYFFSLQIRNAFWASFQLSSPLIFA